MRKAKWERKRELMRAILGYWFREGRGVSATRAARMVGLSPSSHVNGMLSELCDEGRLRGRSEVMTNGWTRYVLSPTEGETSKVQGRLL